MRKIFLSILIVLVSGGMMQAGALAPKDNMLQYDSDGFVVTQPDTPVSDVLPREKSTPSPEIVSIDPKDVKKGETASCFDYYTFGSIHIDVITDYGAYSSGSPIMIRGTVKNNNYYPVVGLDIKARLVKNIPSPSPARAEIMVLDEFDIAENISLDANADFQISYTHLLPINAPAGQYELYLYAVEQDRFNLAGLSFTNDIVAARLSFQVTGNNPDHTYLDQTQIMVGDKPHNVMAFMTQHQSGKNIPITVPLTNPTNTEKRIKVTYRLFSWDTALRENMLKEKTEEVILSPQSSKVLIYEVEFPSFPVYNLQIVAEPIGSSRDVSIFREKTLSNIRFVVEDLSKTRLNFIGVDKYPLKAGEEATLVSCFHNTSALADTRDTKIVTTLFDENGDEITQTVYNGGTVPDITGLVKKFTPKNTLSEFTIESKVIDQKGTLIDTVVKKYSCKDIDPESCQPTPTKVQFLSTSQWQIIAGVALVLLALIGGGIVLVKRKK